MSSARAFESLEVRARLDVDVFRSVRRWAMYRPGAPWLLDAFCGAGGAGMGYWLAGFNVLGVDIKAQKNYPFLFVQGDAVAFIRQFGAAFDVIHASPPCQRYSAITRTAGTQSSHPDLVALTRAALVATGKFFVVENVPGAPLHNPLMLCGTMFDLLVVRHRLFECNPPVWFAPRPCQHLRPVVEHGRQPDHALHYHGVTGHFPDTEFAREAMGIYWMGKPELSESIPPAYTEYIGRQMMRVVSQRQAVAA